MALSNMELEDVQSILGRALIDSDFRSQLVRDPDGVLKILGFGDLSDDAKAFFTALGSGDFPEVAEQVENRLGGRAVIGAWL